MGKNIFKKFALCVTLLFCAITLAACGSSSDNADKVIRIAAGNVGEGAQKVWDAAIAKFSAENPGWTVEFNTQDDDIYETVGLQNQLSGGNPPDAYFEWAGSRTAMHVANGEAADITKSIAESSLKDLFPTTAFNTTIIDGKVYMLPTGSDVTNVIWYDKDLFAKNGFTVPKSWDELMSICAKLKSAKQTCFSIGNKDYWVAGNLFGHIYSRIIGEDLYHQIMSREKPMNSPELVKAFQVVADLNKNGYINASANTIADQEGYTLFSKNGAAMLPIGSWLVGIASEQAPKKNIDWFNLPAFTGGAGDQNSVLGVTTGYVVNAKSKKNDITINFFESFFSDEIITQWVAEGSAPLAKSASAGTPNPATAKLQELLTNASKLVAPPDTGYQLKVADALNVATSEVMGGAKTPQDALDAAEAKLAKK